MEISGNVARLVEDKGGVEIKLLTGSRLLPGLPEKARRIASRSLESRGVEILERARTKRVEADYVHLQDGRRAQWTRPTYGVGHHRPDLSPGIAIPQVLPTFLIMKLRKLVELVYRNIIDQAPVSDLERLIWNRDPVLVHVRTQNRQDNLFHPTIRINDEIVHKSNPLTLSVYHRTTQH